MSNDYPPDWQRRAAAVYERDGYTCQNCGARGGPLGDAELHAHHIVDVASGGSHELSNLTTLCDEYHVATHNSGIDAPTAIDGGRHVGRETRPASRSAASWSERNGRWWIHALLLVFTLGLGNIPYWWWSHRRTRQRRRRHPPQRQRHGDPSPASGPGRSRDRGGVVRWGTWIAGVLMVALLVVVSTVLAVVGIAYAGLAVAQNRHGAYDWLQETELSRLPGLDRDEPDWRAGIATVGYLLLVLVSLRLLVF